MCVCVCVCVCVCQRSTNYRLCVCARKGGGRLGGGNTRTYLTLLMLLQISGEEGGSGREPSIREVREDLPQTCESHSAFPAPWPSALAWPRATATRTRGCGPVRGSARGVCSDEHLSQHLTCWTETLADEPLDLLQGHRTCRGSTVHSRM